MRRLLQWVIRATVVLLSLAAAEPLPAQSGLLTGRVMDDETNQPIAGAQVAMLLEGRRQVAQALTDSTGAFTISVPRQGQYRLRASRLGYAEATTPEVSVGGDRVEVLVRLRTGSVLLAPLEVVATQRRTVIEPRLAEALARMERGMGGRFITREQVRRRNPFKLSDMLDQAGVVINGSNVIMARTRCAPTVWIDGVLASRAQGDGSVFTAINMVDPGTVELVEVYPGPAGMPPEWLHVSRCGAIGIWTRRSP